MQPVRIDGNKDRTKPVVDELTGELRRVQSPDGIMGTERNSGQKGIAKLPDVGEEQVTKNNTIDAGIPKRLQSLPEACLVLVVGAWLRQGPNDRRNTKGFRLALDERRRNTMHADVPEILAARGQQGGHLKPTGAEEGLQRKGAVLASAPADDDSFVVH